MIEVQFLIGIIFVITFFLAAYKWKCYAFWFIAIAFDLSCFIVVFLEWPTNKKIAQQYFIQLLLPKWSLFVALGLLQIRGSFSDNPLFLLCTDRATDTIYVFTGWSLVIAYYLYYLWWMFLHGGFELIKDTDFLPKKGNKVHSKKRTFLHSLIFIPICSLLIFFAFIKNSKLINSC